MIKSSCPSKLHIDAGAAVTHVDNYSIDSQQPLELSQSRGLKDPLIKINALITTTLATKSTRRGLKQIDKNDQREMKVWVWIVKGNQTDYIVFIVSYIEYSI